jgi:hypothetical protein
MKSKVKKIVILQSNYIPWKGYFDMIAAADEFIIYDDVQFTKNDWRNRNKIKTPKGAEWLSIPVGQDISRRIRDVELPNIDWKSKHWKTIVSNYSRCHHFDEVAQIFEPLYTRVQHTHLSQLNRDFIEAISGYLGLTTKFSNSWDYKLEGDTSEKLVSLCLQAGGTEYISGPAAKNYINENIFAESGIKFSWFDYQGYPQYPQQWGEFIHEVSALDLLFNCGKDASNYMKYGR